MPIELHNKQTRTTSIKRKHFLVGPPILLHEESVDFAITYFLLSGNSQRVWALNASCPQVIFFWISGPTKLFSQQKKMVVRRGIIEGQFLEAIRLVSRDYRYEVGQPKKQPFCICCPCKAQGEHGYFTHTFVCVAQDCSTINLL